MKRLSLIAALVAGLFITPAKAETTECTVITSIPTVITAQGIDCLMGNLSSGLSFGKMIDHDYHCTWLEPVEKMGTGSFGGSIIRSAAAVWLASVDRLEVETSGIKALAKKVEVN